MNKNHITKQGTSALTKKIFSRLIIGVAALAVLFFVGRPFFIKYQIERQLAKKNIECHIDSLVEVISDNDLESARKLLEWGVKATDHGSLNQIPIMEAAKKGHVPMIELLLAYGANPEAMDFKERTVLWHLVHAPYSEELYSGVVTLIEAGVGVERKYPDNWNAVIWASKRGALKVVETLVTHGASVEVLDKRGRTPLILAVRRGQLDMVELLLANGVDINRTDSKGRSLLWQASQSSKRNFKLLKVLIENGVNVAGPFLQDWKPLNWMAHFDQPELLALLLDKGADRNGLDRGGNSALMVAAMNRNLGGTKFLLSAGIAPDITNKEGKNALDLVPRVNEEWETLLKTSKD